MARIQADPGPGDDAPAFTRAPDRPVSSAVILSAYGNVDSNPWGWRGGVSAQRRLLALRREPG